MDIQKIEKEIAGTNGEGLKNIIRELTTTLKH